MEFPTLLHLYHQSPNERFITKNCNLLIKSIFLSQILYFILQISDFKFHDLRFILKIWNVEPEMWNLKSKDDIN